MRCGGARSCHSTAFNLIRVEQSLHTTRDGRRVTRKECNRLREEFEVGGFRDLKKRLWILVKKRMLEDRGCLPRTD